MMDAVGVLGLGMYLPAEVRENAWWSAEVVATWRRPTPATLPPPPVDATPGMRAVLAAMAEQAEDPFQGTSKRHVIAADMDIGEMEVRAARAAIEQAGIDLSEIDLVLTSTTPIDRQLTNTACDLHHRLGLPNACFALHVDGAQHAFLLQLTLAETMIKAGQARTALLVQSSAVSRILDYRSPISPVFGDGATAVIVGRVAENRGILASSHHTDGARPYTLIASVPGAAWYADGRAILHMADPSGMREILLRTVDVSVESIQGALARTPYRAADVDVFAMHEGMPWLRRLVQAHTGLEQARAVDTFADTGHLFGAFVPSTLVAAERGGMLHDGDLVVIAGGGNGMSYGATVMRWGRG